MLQTFYKIGNSYQKLGQPLRLSDGITWIFGNCASGKTSILKAVSDILIMGAEAERLERESFFYEFLEEGVQIQCRYTRETSGRISKGTLAFPGLEEPLETLHDVGSPLELFYYVEEQCKNTELRRILTVCHKRLKKKTYIYIPEGDKKRFNFLQSIEEAEKTTLKERFSKAELVVWDDIDLFDDNEILNILTEIIRERKRAVVTARRSKWLKEGFGELEQFYFLKNGELRRAEEWTDKRIISVGQLNNLFLRNAF